MATIYEAEIVSHWVSYSKEELEKILNDTIKNIERKKGNYIQIKITTKDGKK